VGDDGIDVITPKLVELSVSSGVVKIRPKRFGRRFLLEIPDFHQFSILETGDGTVGLKAAVRKRIQEFLRSAL
jgi:hypothetical protein